MSYQSTFSAWKGKAVAAAVALAFGIGTSSAFALNAPALGTTPPPPGTGLELGVFNNTTGASEQVNLGYLFSDVTAPGALTPNTLTAPYTLTSNPAGAGSVYQLDFGVIPQFSNLFGTGSGATYFVVATNDVPSNAYQAIFTSSSATAPLGYGPSDLGTIIAAIGGQTYTGSLGYSASTSTADINSAITGTWAGGTLTNEGPFAGSVGTALNLWSLGYNLDGSFNSATTFANAQGNGFFYLSSGGDLTWNAPTPAPVPLPAAVWLFTSGIAGLGAIARRRRAA